MPSPGVADMENLSIVMSKSNASTRARYCTASTTLKVASIPSVPRFLMYGAWCGCSDGSKARNSILKTSPFGSSRLPSLITNPASCSNCADLRSSARS